MTTTTDAPRFEDVLQQLEDTVERLEGGELSLEDSLSAFERGVGLVRTLNDKLTAVEQRIEVLTAETDGTLRTEPFDPDDA